MSRTEQMSTAEALELAKQIANGIPALPPRLPTSLHDGLHLIVSAEVNRALRLAAYVIERSTPVRPISKTWGMTTKFSCPCEERLVSWNKFCPSCGIPLDWSHA